MVTIAILLIFGLAFAVFALLGPAERARTCDHGAVGDPKCEHCELSGDDAAEVFTSLFPPTDDASPAVSPAGATRTGASS